MLFLFSSPHILIIMENTFSSVFALCSSCLSVSCSRHRMTELVSFGIFWPPNWAKTLVTES